MQPHEVECARAKHNNNQSASYPNRMKVLISSGNSIGQPTGYGAQTTLIARALRHMGHEVVSLAWTAMMGPENAFKMIPMPLFIRSMPTMSKNMIPSDKELFSENTWVMANPYN